MFSFKCFFYQKSAKPKGKPSTVFIVKYDKLKVLRTVHDKN